MDATQMPKKEALILPLGQGLLPFIKRIRLSDGSWSGVVWPSTSISALDRHPMCHPPSLVVSVCFDSQIPQSLAQSCCHGFV